MVKDGMALIRKTSLPEEKEPEEVQEAPCMETEETEDSVCLCKPVQQMLNTAAMTAAMTAMMAANHRTKGGKDEEEDIQISIPADSNNSKPAPTLEVPGIKETKSENFTIT